MEIKALKKSKDGREAVLFIKGLNYQYVNSLRRYMIDEVPTLAIENVEFKQNSSLLYDEIVAHRLGLIVLSNDLKSYELPSEDYRSTDDLPAKCKLTLTMKAKGPGMVYASDIKSKDPKIKPVFPKTPIVKLLKDQELSFIATAVMGQGKAHSKWSPGLFTYKFNPEITINNKSSKFDEFKEKFPEQIFDKTGKIDKKLIIENDLADACEGVCEDIVKIEYDENTFHFRMETWGGLSLKDIAKTACDIFNNQLQEFDKLIKAL